MCPKNVSLKKKKKIVPPCFLSFLFFSFFRPNFLLYMNIKKQTGHRSLVKQTGCDFNFGYAVKFVESSVSKSSPSFF